MGPTSEAASFDALGKGRACPGKPAALAPLASQATAGLARQAERRRVRLASRPPRYERQRARTKSSTPPPFSAPFCPSVFVFHPSGSEASRQPEAASAPNVHPFWSTFMAESARMCTFCALRERIPGKSTRAGGGDDGGDPFTSTLARKRVHEPVYTVPREATTPQPACLTGPSVLTGLLSAETLALARCLHGEAYRRALAPLALWRRLFLEEILLEMGGGYYPDCWPDPLVSAKCSDERFPPTRAEGPPPRRRRK